MSRNIVPRYIRTAEQTGLRREVGRSEEAHFWPTGPTRAADMAKMRTTVAACS
jgi:hypothetical protein